MKPVFADTFYYLALLSLRHWQSSLTTNVASAKLLFVDAHSPSGFCGLLCDAGREKLPLMQQAPETFFNLEDFVPSLREQFEERPLNPKKLLLVALQVKDPQEHPKLVPAGMDRRSLAIADGQEFWFWEADSLQALFRGDKQPPVLGDYPVAYNECFLLLDMHALEISRFFGDRRDTEMKEIYSALRRRPDGRSLGFVHDYMWQAAALVLGTRPLSQAEFEAIMARLERSCRTFEQGPTSKNYVTMLKQTLGRAGEQPGIHRGSR